MKKDKKGGRGEFQERVCEGIEGEDNDHDDEEGKGEGESESESEGRRSEQYSLSSFAPFCSRQ